MKHRAGVPIAPVEPLCADCPDHEACMTGYPCDVVREATQPIVVREPSYENPHDHKGKPDIFAAAVTVLALSASIGTWVFLGAVVVFLRVICTLAVIGLLTGG